MTYGFIKIGEDLSFSMKNILTPREALVDEKITARFIKLAKKLRKVAPRAKDFLYGHCLMMHAAEAALVDQETGLPILNKKGKPVSGTFEPVKLSNGKESLKWVSSDNIMPYKNANGDIFPEDELIKAYKKWIGKPLCKDHNSDSVDGIRGIVIDTFYDPKFKRVHALFALDRKNYGDLARKVETGYANCVSMGTGVGQSICTECHNIALTEKDYCKCIQAHTNYGEINRDLSPIELSLVVNGADGAARIKEIVASMGVYVAKKQARIDKLTSSRCVNPTELQSLADSVNEIQTKLNSLMQIEKSADLNAGQLLKAIEVRNKEDDPEMVKLLDEMIAKAKEKMKSDVEPEPAPEPEPTEESEAISQAERTGGEGYAHTTPEWIGSATEIGINPTNRLASRKGKNKKKEGGKQGVFSNEISLLRSKIEKMDKSLKELKSIYTEDNYMNSARLKARALKRRAYWLGGGGVNEPTPGKTKYPVEDYTTVRDKEDKQMVGEPLETGSDGLHPGDLEVKKKLLRAEELKNRKLRREAFLESVNNSDANGNDLKARALKRRAYWQGGGGINEPTPGKPKYSAEDYTTVRDKEDKQMVGEPLDTGRDGLHPGDLEIKKKWLRARLRALFTKVADNKGNVVKEASRWDIYAGDKLILTATGSEIFGEQLYDKIAGDANKEFSTNWDFLKSAEYGKEVIRHIREEGFDKTAYLLKGAQDPAVPAVPADPAAAPAPADPLAGLGEAELAPVSEKGSGGEVEVKQEKGETQQKVDAALNDMEEKIAEVRDLVSGMDSEELVDIDVNIESKDKGEKPAELAGGASEEMPMEGVLASREDILKVEALMNVSADELAEVSETLENLNKVDESNHQKILVAALAALEDSETILSHAELVITSAKKKDDKKDKDDKKKEDKKDKDEEDKKDKDEEDKKKKDEKEDKKKEAQKLLDDALRIRAENRATLLSSAMGLEEPMYVAEEPMYVAEEPVGESVEGCGCGDPECLGCPEADASYLLSPEDEGRVLKLLTQEEAEGHNLQLADDKDKDDKKDKKDKDDDDDEDDKKKKDDKDDKKGGCSECGGKLVFGKCYSDDCPKSAKKDKKDKDEDDAFDGFAAFDGAVQESQDSVFASRKSERDALVARAADKILGKYELDLGPAKNVTEKTYFAAHPGGKGTVTDLTYTKTPEAKVETISEVHDVMRDVAESGPRNVREAAALIQEGIVKGALTAEDVDRLVAEGKVDATAAAYWKKYFSLAPDAGSFGADMSKEFGTKKKEAANKNWKIKLRRAYDVGLEAQDKGLINGSRSSLEDYVDNLMNFDDPAFESNKRLVASYNGSKHSSGALPNVGTEGAAKPIEITASTNKNELDLSSALQGMNWGGMK